jgi:uncharacterized protein YxjI
MEKRDCSEWHLFFMLFTCIGYDGRLSMFDKIQYVIEMTLRDRFVPFSRDTYSIRDKQGNLLGYAKKQRLKFWFEGTDGTRMGEISSSKKGYEIYDAQNHLQATIKQKPRSPTKKGNLGAILFIAGLTVAMLGFVFYLTSLLTSWLVIIFIGVALAFLGGYYLFSTIKKPEWRVEDSEGEQLAEIKEVGKFFAEYQVLTPDGSVIAHIRRKRGLAAFRYSYSIDITRPVLDPRFIISYAIFRADMDRGTASSAPMPALII